MGAANDDIINGSHYTILGTSIYSIPTNLNKEMNRIFSCFLR